MILKDILNNISVVKIEGSLDIEISALAFDSRKVQEQSLFIATVGVTTDGHTFIDKAIELGAVAILCQSLPTKLDSKVTYIQVIDSNDSLGLVSSNFYNNPSNKVKLVGVTGTNGKTTCATLLFQLFSGLGYKCGLLSTINNRIGDEIIPSTHTTPDALSLNMLLRKMVDSGCEYVFMEVSSHAIAQKRISGLSFCGGVFTNITHDHLDFHKTFDEYIRTKKLFFDNLPSSAFALVNIDDKRGMVMLQNTKALKKTYSLLSMADFKAKEIDSDFSGMQLDINGIDVWFKLIGRFNAYNLLAVYATAILLKQDSMQTLKVLSNLTGAEGRFNYILSKNNIVGIVDYAHTPDALLNVLSTINNIRTKSQQIITVVGCGGDRDAEKRPIMAKIASDNSDKTILTSDNPRSENPEDILTQMKKGVSNNLNVISITDRREAIKTAFLFAKNEDIILIAGKGHEKYQEINGVKHHFDDMEELRKIFELQ